MEPYRLNMEQLKRDMAQHAETAQARNDFAKESLWNVLTALLNYGEAAARKEAKMEARTILDVDQFATKEEKGEVIKVSNGLLSSAREIARRLTTTATFFSEPRIPEKFAVELHRYQYICQLARANKRDEMEQDLLESGHSSYLKAATLNLFNGVPTFDGRDGL